MIIIDGNNLLHAVYKIDQESISIHAIELCRIVSRYLKLIGRDGEIVFDGVGPKDKSPFENIEIPEVFFAGAGADADSVIEEKIRLNSAPKRLTIVSSDRRLRKAAHTRTATAVKSEEFWEQLQKQLSKKRPIPEPKAKREGISEIETKQWLDFFGIEQ
jgi:predicted RNA-binding protein with PIN domain